jgi:hypothetical protein
MSKVLQAHRLSSHERANRRAWIVIVALCAIGAGAVIHRLGTLAVISPRGPVAQANMDAHFRAKAALTLLHIVPSLLFVLLLPTQFVSSLRLRWPHFHRWTGRAVMGLGAVVGLSALVLSLHPVGGIAESSATLLFGSLFLVFLVAAWRHIRNGRVQLHREWVTRMTAVALGVATVRPIMAVFFATSRLTGLTPEQFFGPAMWLGFTLTYLAGEAWIRYTRLRIGQKDDLAFSDFRTIPNEVKL